MELQIDEAKAMSKPLLLRYINRCDSEVTGGKKLRGAKLERLKKQMQHQKLIQPAS